MKLGEEQRCVWVCVYVCVHSYVLLLLVFEGGVGGGICFVIC